jgi:hypothetical protein
MLAVRQRAGMRTHSCTRAGRVLLARRGSNPVTLRRSARWRSAVAGAGAAAPSILLTGANVRRDELSLYFLLRGVTLLVRTGNKAPAGSLLRRALALTRWRHGDSAMMCASTWQILYSYLMMPSTLPRGYIKFLDRMAGFDSWLIPVARVRCSSTQSRRIHIAASMAGLLLTRH